MNRGMRFAPENYFHIYNRGVEKRKIFLEHNDYQRFLALLYLCNSPMPVNVRDLFYKGLTFVEIFSVERKETLVDIGAYCLMPNHIHLLIKAKDEEGVSRFMQKLFTGYTMYFNKKNGRTGSLFESTFKANPAKSDKYLKYLFAYIHLNPIKLIDPKWKEEGIKNLKRARKFLGDYRWFSYDYYRGKRQQDRILNIGEFPEYFRKNTKEFADFIEDWFLVNKGLTFDKG